MLWSYHHLNKHQLLLHHIIPCSFPVTEITNEGCAEDLIPAQTERGHANMLHANADSRSRSDEHDKSRDNNKSGLQEHLLT